MKVQVLVALPFTGPNFSASAAERRQAKDLYAGSIRYYCYEAYVTVNDLRQQPGMSSKKGMSMVLTTT